MFFKSKQMKLFTGIARMNSLNNISMRYYRYMIHNVASKFKNIELDYNNNEMLNASDIFYQSLKRNNVSNTFIYSGGSIMPLIDKLYKSDINYYVNSHEQNCGHAATGYAKSSNKTGVVMVTSGPGITNMITPMLDAKNDSTPLVVFSGQVSLDNIGSNAFQEAPAVELSKHVTKFSYQIKNILELEYIIDKAFSIANDGKKGSVHIDIPKCVASSTISKNEYILMKDSYNYKDLFKTNVNNIFNELKYKVTNYNNNNNITYDKVVSIINNSKKPLIYLGQGCNNDYELLREFAIKANIPVTSTIHACGTFDESHSLSLQWCGMHGSAAANYTIQEADCIIALGSRFDDRTTGNIEHYAPKAFEAGLNNTGGIIHVNIEKSEINKVVKSHYNFNISCKEFLENTIDKIKYNNRSQWIHRVNKLKQRYYFSKYYLDNKFADKNNNIVKNNLLMEDVLTSLYKNTKREEDNIIFTTGVGNHQMQTYQYIKSHYPKKIISSGSLGVMGAGLPYAIGAKIANNDKMVILIDGDSSFNMTLTDLKTIAEHKLPIKICIMNNDSQMMVTIWEKLFFNERYTATINEKNPSFTKLAESYGLKSLYCDNVNNLEETIHEFISYPDSILCEFKIEKGICLPLVGPGKALDDMILHENYHSNIKIEDGLAPS